MIQLQQGWIHAISLEQVFANAAVDVVFCFKAVHLLQFDRE
jgi:hypothetical protein